jgi:hypothetical protein
MKKLIILTITLMTYLGASAQEVAWEKIIIDENVTVNLPSDMEVQDTLGQKIIIAETENAVIVITRSPNGTMSDVEIKTPEELAEFYSGIISGVARQSFGEVLNNEDITLNNLKGQQFTLKIQVEDEVQLRDYFIIFLDNTFYSFQFWQLEEMYHETSEERTAFFESISLNSILTPEKQLTSAK